MTRSAPRRKYNVPLLSAMALALVCLLTLVGLAFFTINHVDSHAETTAHDMLRTNFSKMEAEFTIAQSAARSAAWYARNIGSSSKEKTYEIAHQLLRSEKHIAGCGIMTKPERGGYVYSYRDTINNNVFHDTEAAAIKNLDYTAREYYRMMTEGKEGWTQPYETDAIDQYQCTMASYIVPLSDDTAYAEALCVDVALDWIQEYVTKALPYEGAISALYDQEGNVILQSVRDEADDDTNMMAYEVDTSKPGTYEIGSKGKYIAIVEHLSNGWHSALLIPATSLYNYLFRVLCGVFVLMIAVFLFLFFRIIFKARRGPANITGFIGFFIVSLVILSVVSLYSIKTMNKMSEDFASQVMSGSLSQIDTQTKMIEDIGHSTEWYLKYIMSNDQQVYSWAQQIMSINNNILICGLAYASDYGKGAHFPCVIDNGDGKFRKVDIAANSDFYFNREYYKIAKAGKSGWTKPYESYIGLGFKGYIMTYVIPIMTGGKFSALLDLDINLAAIHNKAASKIPYADAITATFDENNNIVSSSMREKDGSVSTDIQKERDLMEQTLLDQLRKKIADKTTLRYGSSKYLAFTAKLPNGCTGALIVPQDAVHHEAHTYLAAVGLFTLFFFFIVYLYLLPRIRRREGQ